MLRKRSKSADQGLAGHGTSQGNAVPADRSGTKPAVTREPPFDRGFWSGRKGDAIGSTAAEPVPGTAILSKTSGADGNERQFPADLRRAGPFSSGKKGSGPAAASTEDHREVRNSPAPSAARDAKILRQKETETSADTSSAGLFSQRASGNNTTPDADAKPVMQLDDFEPKPKAWQRNRREPVAPRVHPNPKPVIARGFTEAKGKRAPAATELAGIQSSTAGSSFVLPVALLLFLGLFLAGGYYYVSNIANGGGAAGGNARLIMDAEIMLEEIQFDPGRIDGIADDALRDAIVGFQSMTGITEDGEVSENLIRELKTVRAMLEGS